MLVGILAVLVTSQFGLSHGFGIQPKIVGGQVINTTVPYFVSLSNDLVKCSGSLISDSYVFWTAAFAL